MNYLYVDNSYGARTKNLLASHQLNRVQCRYTTQLQIVTKISTMKKSNTFREPLERRTDISTWPIILYRRRNSGQHSSLRSTFASKKIFCTRFMPSLNAVQRLPNNQHVTWWQTQISITATWLLAILFDHLVLAPNHDTDRSINQVVHERIRWFRSGQIKKHFQKTKKDTSPREQATHPPDVSKAAAKTWILRLWQLQSLRTTPGWLDSTWKTKRNS